MSKHIEVVSDKSVFKSSDDPRELIAAVICPIGWMVSQESEREVTVRDDDGNQATGRGETSSTALANAVRNLE